MQLAHAIAAGAEDDPLAPRVVALTLAHAGEAMKWEAARERPDFLALHGLLGTLPAERRREPLVVPAEGRGREAMVESLYFRALLLDRFASGSLTRQQVEVLDAWLWEWMPQLLGTASDPGGPFLRVDLDANAGLREGSRGDDDGPCLYLPLPALEGLRRAVVRELHRGRMVPAHGCAGEMRLEEHVAVLEALRRAFEPAEGEREKRARREHASGTRTEVWLGLEEIRALGFGLGDAPAPVPALSLVESPLVASGGSAPPPAPGAVDPTRRYLWRVDESATGVGFEALESDARGIEVGDVLGWRGEGGACELGRVSRRLAAGADGQVFLGVQRLGAAHALRLARRHPFEQGSAESTHLFVPGADESGRHDAFLVPEKEYATGEAYHARPGEGVFTVQFNRVRARGRGWILAGFEVLPAAARPPEAAPQHAAAPDAPARGAPPLELVLDEGLLDRALEREVGTRLLG